MYNWNKLSPEERERVLEERKARGFPWHSPPHIQFESEQYHITAACYRHQAIIGRSVQRIEAFSHKLLLSLKESNIVVHAWCVLLNHYHILAEHLDVKFIAATLGRLHGRTSFMWNGEDQQRGRRVWHRCADRSIRNENHLWATVNYIHHNPVRHGYVKKWQDWPFSSASEFILKEGMDKVKQIWEDYPLFDYGK
ncbi:transposase [bacterium]|nr:transposase [bacterium]